MMSALDLRDGALCECLCGDVRLVCLDVRLGCTREILVPTRRMLVRRRCLVLFSGEVLLFFTFEKLHALVS